MKTFEVKLSGRVNATAVVTVAAQDVNEAIQHALDRVEDGEVEHVAPDREDFAVDTIHEQ